jgi:hypothetical protein
MNLAPASLSLLASLAFIACGDSKTRDESKPGDKVEVTMDGPSLDWSGTERKNISDTVDGIPFSIDLPAQLKREEKASDGTFPGYVTWNGPNPFLDPSFTAQIATFPPKDLAEAEASALRGTDPREILSKGELAGGGFCVSAAETSKKYLNVEVWQTSASTGKVVRFSIGTRSSDAIPNLDKLRLWMEAVVSSFKVQ